MKRDEEREKLIEPKRKAEREAHVTK